MITADAVQVGDIIWGRTVAAVTLPDRTDKWDTSVMFEFEDGVLMHVSQNRVIDDHQRPNKELAGAIDGLKAYQRWAATGSDHRLRGHARDIRIVLEALAAAQERVKIVEERRTEEAQSMGRWSQAKDDHW